MSHFVPAEHHGDTKTHSHVTCPAAQWSQRFKTWDKPVELSGSKVTAQREWCAGDPNFFRSMALICPVSCGCLAENSAQLLPPLLGQFIRVTCPCRFLGKKAAAMDQGIWKIWHPITTPVHPHCPRANWMDYHSLCLLLNPVKSHKTPSPWNPIESESNETGILRQTQFKSHPH